MHIHPEILLDVFAAFKYLQEQGWKGILYHTPPQFEVMTLYGNRLVSSNETKPRGLYSRSERRDESDGECEIAIHVMCNYYTNRNI